MPELSALLANKRWVSVEYNDIIFNVAYRPSSMSLMAQAELQDKLKTLQASNDMSAQDQVKSTGEIFAQIVCDWDWTDNGETIPITLDTILRILPGAAIISALDAVTSDGATSSAEKKASKSRSGAGLPVGGKLEIVQNGIQYSEELSTWG